MDGLSKYVFVTVGTTLFDDLVEAVDNLDLHECLKQQGYKGIIIQIGVTTYKPKHAVELPEVPKKYDFSKKKFHAFYFTQKPSIEQYIADADLVISHAGAGSITETLEKKKPIVVVINTKLMNNHQAELAERLHKYVLVSDPSTLTHVIGTDLPLYLKDRTKYKRVDSSEFGEYMLQKFDINDSGKKKSKNAPKSNKKVKTMVVLGSGGHTAEMFVELENMNTEVFTPRHYVLASNDQRSEDKIQPFEQKTKTKEHSIHKIPRSRRVGQSYFTSIWTTFISFLFCFKLVLNTKPDLIICNGPGTCVPIVMAAVLLRFLRITQTKIVFIESLARVQHLSLSGKILQHFVDWFVIQWPSLVTLVSKKTELHIQNFYFPLD